MNWLFVRLPGKEGERPAEGLPTEAVQAAPADDDPPGVWAEAVSSAADKGLAAEWLARVEGDGPLAEVAVRSRFAEVRLAAARRITDLATLKRVAEASKEKDKHVYRYCADMLRAARQETERARRAIELAAAVRVLLEATPVAISHLLQIEKDLAALGKGGKETAECEALLEEARARVLHETQTQIELKARLGSAESLLADLRAAAAPSAEELAEWSAQHSALSEESVDTPAWLRTVPAGRALAAALEDIEARLIAHGDSIERALDEEEQRLAAEAAAQEAQRVAEEANRVATEAAGSAPAPKKKVDQEALQKLAAEFEADLEQGRIVEAEAVSKKIDRLLGGAHASGQVARRLQRARAQQARLAGWAKWGTDQAREQLIAVAEALLKGEPDIAERARAVPLLRREWKNLDGHGGASQALWKKFDRALERAYKPVAEQRAIEAAANEAARAAKSSLLESWTAWYAEQTAPDLKALDARREQIMSQWRSAPRAGFREERDLRKKFDALIGKIDAHLESARAAESARLKDLVAQAEALKDTAELGPAMSAAKTLQRRWKEEVTGIRLRHGEDQKLWRRFRAACDAVFARRDAEQTEREAQRTKRDEERKAEIEAARLVEAKKKEKHAARFAVMAEKAAPTADVPADALEKGKAERDAVLIDLEIALELATPESHAVARRARNLARLQDRFSKGITAQPEPEALVAKWYAIPAASDETQAARMAAVVARLLERPSQARKDSRS